MRLVAVVAMLGAERLLANCQRPLVERPRAGEVALGLMQIGEVLEAPRGIGMLGAERLLSGRQRPLEKGPSLRIGRERPIPIRSKPVQQIARARPVSPASPASLSYWNGKSPCVTLTYLVGDGVDLQISKFSLSP